MQKLIKFLEQYVQWAGLALGALFLGFMIWAYIVHNPAERQMPGLQDPTVTPGDVDKLIADGPASDLDHRSHGANSGFRIAVPSPKPLEVDPNPVGATTPVAGTLWDSWPYDLAKVIKSSGIINNGQLVQALPVLPPVTYMDQEALRTVLQVTNANGQTDQQDSDSVTTFWQLPVAGLSKAFDQAFSGKLTPNQETTMFVRADLIRQEEIGQNQWGPDVIVDRAVDSAAAAFPQGH